MSVSGNRGIRGQADGVLSVDVWLVSPLLASDEQELFVVPLCVLCRAPAWPASVPLGVSFLDPVRCDSMKWRQRSAKAPLSNPISASSSTRLLMDLDRANFGPISRTLVRSAGRGVSVRLCTLFVSDDVCGVDFWCEVILL